VSGVVHSVHIQMRSSISSYGVEFQALIWSSISCSIAKVPWLESEVGILLKEVEV
jgi:hypothetical protein